MALSTSRTVRALDHDYSAAVTLGVGVLAALTWSVSNSTSYQDVIVAPWSRRSGATPINSWHDLVATGLMTIFFFAIGLELSRERSDGALAKPSRAVAPVLGALGGMVVTAGLSLLAGGLTDTPALRLGWGIPMATDIAFALGALALAGRGLPSALRQFLLTLAVADDVFSVVVLAGTGAAPVRTSGLIAALLIVAAIRLFARHLVAIPARLAILGVLWICFVLAHVEPPLAGVLAGVIVPFHRRSTPQLEDFVRRVSTGLVLPLFALVSCGLRWSVIVGHQVTAIVVATVVIRIVGKIVGVTGGVALARLIGFRLPASIPVALLWTSSLLCAIGFTVPLIFAGALFPISGPTYGAFALGLLISSLLSGILGIVLLKYQTRRR